MAARPVAVQQVVVPGQPGVRLVQPVGVGTAPQPVRVIRARLPAPAGQPVPVATAVVPSSPSAPRVIAAPLVQNGGYRPAQYAATTAGAGRPAVAAARTLLQGSLQPVIAPSGGLQAPLRRPSTTVAVPAGGLPSGVSHGMDLKDAKTLSLAVQNPRVLQQFASCFFRTYDADKNGVLSLQELEALLPRLHLEMGLDPVRPLHGATVRDRMKKFDKNHDGVLTEAEFSDLIRWYMWRRYEEIKPPLLRRGDLIGKAHEGVPSQHYSFGDQLGIGSFGVVHRVKHLATGLDRVMKTVNKARAVAGGTPLGEIRQEIDLLAMLDHPNVLKLFEWFNDTENVYIVTDQCSGGDVLDLLKQSSEKQWPVPGPWIARIFRQTLEAIGYCHRKGVMHKDLKFENIMLQSPVTPDSQLHDVTAIVIDVGLAELFGAQHDKNSRSTSRAGSLATMAPEVLRGDFSYKCDIWSIGCMLFAMYNAEPFYVPDGEGGQILYMYPFYPKAAGRDKLGLHSLFEAQRRGPPMELVQAGGEQLCALLSEMLQFNEDVRPTAQQCLLSVWFHMGEDQLKGPEQHFTQEHITAFLGDRNKYLVWRSAMLQAASMLPATKLEPMARWFREADTNKDGSIDTEELRTVLAGRGISPELASRAAEAADFNGDGAIEWSEFVACCLPAARELFAVSLQAAFAAADRDRNGYIDFQELQEMFDSGQVEMPSKKTVDAILQELDANHDGKVSFSEFQEYYLHAEAV